VRAVTSPFVTKAYLSRRDFITRTAFEVSKGDS